MDDKQPKKQNNKTGRLLLMAVLAIVVIYAGSRFTNSSPQPLSSAPAATAQSVSGGLTLLTEPPAESAQPLTPEASDTPLTPEASDATLPPEETPPAEGGSYTEVEDVAYYLHTYGRLPDNYLTKSEAEDAGWVSYKGNLWDVAYGTSIGGDRYGNYDGQLPKGERYYEADVNYDGGYRGEERIVYTEDGDIWYTSDHYESFERLY